MAVSQVTQNQSIIKLALAKKGIKTGQSKKLPEYLQMSGSIFKAPGVVQPQMVGMNTQKSIEDLKNNQQPVTPEESKNTKPKEDENKEPTYETSVSGGKQAISDAEDVQGETEELTSTTKKHEKVVSKFANNAARLAKSTTADDKKFNSQVRAEQNQIKNDNAKIAKLIKENEELEKEIDDAQRELDSINFNSSGDDAAYGLSGSTSSSAMGRTGQIRAIIGAKVGLMQRNGKSIYSLQRSSSRSLRRMNRVQRNYVKAQKVKTKEINNQQNETSGIIKVAQEVEKWSTIAQSSGQALNLLGKVFVAIGSSTSGFFGIGAALVTIGTVMQKVGTVVELVGKYGQTAANITKSAAYAAEGNLLGAAMSTAAAIQSGAAAIKGTKELSGTFGKINEEANAATQKIAAKEAAKQTVEQMKENGELAKSGLTEKQAQKLVTADLRNTMAGNNDLKGKNLNELRDYLNTNPENSTNTVAKSSFDKMAEKGSSIIQNSETTKAANRAIKAEIKRIKPKSNMDWGGNISALGSSIQNIATALATNDTVNSYKAGGKKKLAPAQLDARTRRIMEKNQRYRAIRHSYAA